MAYYFDDGQINKIKEKLPYRKECRGKMVHEQIPGDSLARFLVVKGEYRGYPVEENYLCIARNCTDNEKRYSDEECKKVTRDLKREIERLFGYKAEVEFRFAFEWEEISYPPYPHECPYSITLYRHYLEAKIDLSKPTYRRRK